jgi:hypothetical protein
MTTENAGQVMDAATAYLRELCPPGMDFVLIIGTTGTDGRSISYETSLPPDQTADMLREALELAQEEDA